MKRLVESFEEFTSKKSGVKKLNEGTGNFYNRNASKIYAIGINDSRSGGEDTDEDGGYSYNEYEFENDIEYIQEQLQEVFDRFNAGDFYEGVERSLYNHSHPITPIGVINDYIKVRDGEYGVSIYCFATSGYYEGANLDWVAYVEDLDGYEFELGDGEIPSKVQKWFTVNIPKVESVYAKCSTSLEVSARFSNGETWYKEYK